jgi:hypothetical protein
MEFLILTLVLVGVFFSGWKAREMLAMRTINALIAQAEESEANLKAIKVKVEKHSDQFFVHREDDGTFMAQGKNMDELDKALRNRFPDTRFLIQEDNLKELGLNNESI